MENNHYLGKSIETRAKQHENTIYFLMSMGVIGVSAVISMFVIKESKK